MMLQSSGRLTSSFLNRPTFGYFDPMSYFGPVGVGSVVQLTIRSVVDINNTNCGFAPGLDSDGRTYFYNQDVGQDGFSHNMFSNLTYFLCTAVDHRNGATLTMPAGVGLALPYVTFDMSQCTPAQIANWNLSAVGSALYSMEYAFRDPARGLNTIRHYRTNYFDLVAECSPVQNITGVRDGGTVALAWDTGPAKVQIQRSFDGGANWTIIVNNYIGTGYVDTFNPASPNPIYKMYAICSASGTDYVSVDADLNFIYDAGGRCRYRRANLRR